MPAESPRRRSAVTAVKCQKCNQEFSRSEHLTRHLRTHTNERPHVCPVCNKGFSRMDVLTRHQAAHGDSRTDEERHGPAFRACGSCASARVKCLGSQPCQRCSVKGIDCHYPPTRLSQHQSRTGEVRASQTGMVSEPTLSSRQASDMAGLADSQDQTWIELNVPAATNGLMGADPQPWSAGCEGQRENIEPNFGYPSVTPYDFALLSNQSIEQPQVGDYGYSAINWLAPKDLGYSEFNYESQFFDVDDINFWSGPAVQAMLEPEIVNIADVNMGGQTFVQTGQVQGEQTFPRPINTEAVQSIPASTSDIDSPQTVSTPSRSSNFYVDGAGAREPRYGKLRKQRMDFEGIGDTPLPILDVDIGNGHSLSFPPSIERFAIGQSDVNTLSMSSDIHQRLVDEYRKMCFREVLVSTTGYFPSIGIFESAKRMYFEYFHPTCPLLHKPSITNSSQPWIIELAIAAIGIAYLGTRDSQQCSEAFMELLSRCLESSAAFDSNIRDLGNGDPDRQDSVQIQARILCCVAMFHSRNLDFVEKAFSMRSQLVGLCLRRKMLYSSAEPPEDPKKTRMAIWQYFITKESKIRAGYCIFWLDCVMAYQSDFRPQLRLEDERAPLPCHDESWEAVDEVVWHRSQAQRPDTPSLLVALESLYKKKTVSPNIGDFSRILLIHGLYHRTWEVARYHKDTLSNWIPSVPGTRTASPSPSASDQATEWLPRNPTFSKWRNSACDCLDVLHWSANSLVAQRAGLEHPTILHLHLARLILLTPAPTIQSLASILVQNAKDGSGMQSSSQAQYHSDRSEILRWFIQDQYKARLALVHAGAIFWHVRRYSHDSLLEQFAVLLATLVIWAYATSSQAIEQQQRQGLANLNSNRDKQPESFSTQTQTPTSHPEEESIDLPFINLDRLCDDELIQMYVLHGSRMKGFMAGMGNICHEGSPLKILHEGAKIIGVNGTHRGGGEAMLPTWGVGVRHAVFLGTLADACRRRTVG